MDQINVREIKISDYNDIYLLNQELGYFYPIEKVKERIAYITQNTKDIILVAQQDNEVIGYIHGSPYELLYSDSLINILGFVVKDRDTWKGVEADYIAKNVLDAVRWIINDLYPEK